MCIETATQSTGQSQVSPGLRMTRRPGGEGFPGLLGDDLGAAVLFRRHMAARPQGVLDRAVRPVHAPPLV